MSITKILSSTAIAAGIALGGLAFTAPSASAYVACNHTECWHTDRRYHYGRDVAIVHHPDDWYFHRDWNRDHAYAWREHHEGRGYYRNGVWITF